MAKSNIAAKISSMAFFDQTNQHSPKILIAGSKSGYSYSACQVLEQLNIDYVHSPNADAALKQVNASPKSFAVVLSDQDIPGMSGVALLAGIKSKNPSILRFLVSDSFNLDLLVSSVNKAGVHQCIQGPFTPEDIAEKIRQAVNLYIQDVERRRMFNLARKQNGRLYELNCELIETVKSSEKELARLETRTGELHDQINNKTIERPLSPSKLTGLIKKSLGEIKADKTRTLGQLYEQTIVTLYTDFNNFALGNGIEIAAPQDLIQQDLIQQNLIQQNLLDNNNDTSLPGQASDTDKGAQDA